METFNFMQRNTPSGSRNKKLFLIRCSSRHFRTVDRQKTHMWFRCQFHVWCKPPRKDQLMSASIFVTQIAFRNSWIWYRCVSDRISRRRIILRLTVEDERRRIYNETSVKSLAYYTGCLKMKGQYSMVKNKTKMFYKRASKSAFIRELQPFFLNIFKSVREKITKLGDFDKFYWLNRIFRSNLLIFQHGCHNWGLRRTKCVSIFFYAFFF